MKLGARIFFCYVAIFMVCFYYPINFVLDNLRTRYLEGVEDPLVDQANIFAGIIGSEMALKQFDPERWHAIFKNVYSRSFSARIYNFEKRDVDMSVYITDRDGKILFDSTTRENTGKDYSKWRDVHLTLSGKYGARTTRIDENVPDSSVLYVAAPIRVDGEVAGAVTLAKPTTNINNFLKSAKPKISKAGFMAVTTAMLLSLFASFWITRPIKRLTHYADEIRRGRRVPFPRLGKTEIGEMGAAFEKMKEALEGKNYVEHYVQTLTHEIKSPLSAIRGAAELLEEKMEPERRSRFLSNIRTEANRVQEIVDRMLKLSELETLKNLRKVERVSFQSIVKTVCESKQPMLLKRQLCINTRVSDDIIVKGDSFLLHQAVGNLIQNAIDFSPAHGRIDLAASIDGERLNFSVEDGGPGIPDYAREKVFEKFFSLQRPDSGKKSTGLGLNFVREVAHLHGGSVRLKNRPEKGVRATLTLPL